MITSEVQRTLVKSPPELWTELSDPEALARHLGELGEVEIVRTQPEQLVEWKTADATGTVRIKPSGWGTKVTLTVSKELPEPAEALAEPEPPVTEPIEDDDAIAAEADVEEAVHEPEDEPLSETLPEEPAAPGPAAVESEPVTQVFAADEPLDTAAMEEEPELEQASPAPPQRRGFFARLFGRRPKSEPAVAESPSQEAETQVPALLETQAEPRQAEAIIASEAELVAPSAVPEPADAGATPDEPAKPEDGAEELPVDDEASEPVGEDGEQAQIANGEEDPVPAIDMAAELKAAEEVAEEEVRAVLTAVLDRLGAAHHRPFSRA